MMRSRKAFRLAIAAVLSVVVCTGVVAVVHLNETVRRTHVIAEFANANGIYAGDAIRILGVPVGKIDAIVPDPSGVKISFWYDTKYSVPASADAVILAPSLVTARSIQLTPAYTGGPKMSAGAVIPKERTAVPVEWDDFRRQVQRLTDTLQPTQPGNVSTLGAFVNTAADNLRGQGSNIREAIIKLSQVFSALGDHSQDIFGTIKNLALLVSALRDSTDLLRNLNQNLASVTGLLTHGDDQVGHAIEDINDVVGDVDSFVHDNREALGTTTDKLTSVTQALNESLGDVKQTLHIAPNAFQNFLNIYQPAQGTLSGNLGANNFANPISFLCGAIQAASRLNAEQSSKLCVQYLAPIIKNRQMNYFPVGENLFVGAAARPNELTYSEDSLRPDYVPPQAPPTPGAAPSNPGAQPAPAPKVQTPDPAAAGLQGLMTPPGAGS